MNLLLRFSFIALSFSSLAVQGEPLRLVVSYQTAINQQSFTKVVENMATDENVCLKTLDGTATICVPSPKLMIESQAKKSNKKTSPFQAFPVDIGNADAEQVLATLNSTGWYKTVERDVMIRVETQSPIASQAVSVRAASNDDIPDDPEYGNQYYLHDNSESLITGSGFTSAISKSTNNDTRMGIAVLDTSFWSTTELIFKGGASFVTAWENERGIDNYIFADSSEEERQLCGGHGTGVAGVIGSSINNGQQISGAIDNVDVYALRVMDCGLGFLSDAADALRWISGVSFPEVPDFTGEIQVANLSLGGASATCSNYMQDAIDTATAAGITVVIAAGNAGMNVSDWVPSNCSGAIIVGSTDRSGVQAAFSNYGDNVDISAQGVDILSSGWAEETTYWWEGTSFSAPLVTAGVAIAKREKPSLADSEIKFIMSVSAKPMLSDCSNKGCGEGVMDVNASVDIIQQINEGNINIIKHALAEKNECDQQWYVDHFGDSTPLCSLYNINFITELNAGNKHYRLTRRQLSEASNTTDEEVLTTSKASILLSDIDVETYTYGYQICTDGICGKTWDLESSNASSPAACSPQ